VDSDLKKLAARFLDFVEGATGLPMIVCDETGTIVECKTASRIGTVHAFARRIVSGEADELFVTSEEAAADPKMKEGCNVVIFADGMRLGTFGIAGPLGLARPLARVAAAVFTSWLKDQRQQLALAGAADGVFGGVSRVSARAQEVTTETAEVVAAMSSASRDALEKVQQSGKIIQTVQEVAHQIRILSINGSMEAARAGAQGRPFAVVAREMLDLSESARGAANQIETTLGEVQQAIGELTKAIDRSAALANTQSSALTEVKSVVDELQRVVSQLTGEGNG
jgi:hypothetical protein